MLNQTILVGRLVKKPTITITEDEKKVSTITLAVSRSYKNADGIYETDFIDCVLWSGIAENTAEYCNKGDIIGVKGRIQTKMIEKEDGTKQKITEVIAEKVTFLSSKKEGGEE